MRRCSAPQHRRSCCTAVGSDGLQRASANGSRCAGVKQLRPEREQSGRRLCLQDQGHHAYAGSGSGSGSGQRAAVAGTAWRSRGPGPASDSTPPSRPLAWPAWSAPGMVLAIVRLMPIVCTSAARDWRYPLPALLPPVSGSARRLHLRLAGGTVPLFCLLVRQFIDDLGFERQQLT